MPRWKRVYNIVCAVVCDSSRLSAMKSRAYFSKLAEQASTLLTDVQNGAFNVLMSIVLKVVIIIGMAYLLYSRINSENIIERSLVITAAGVCISMLLASWSKGQWEDQVVTFLVFTAVFSIYYSSYWTLHEVFDFEITNPLVVLFYTVLSFFAIIIVMSRYTYMNIVKVAGWAIGIAVVGLFVFTYSVYEILSLCEIEEQSEGYRDSIWVSISAYLSFFVLVGMVFFAELIPTWNRAKYGLVFCAFLLTGVLLWYTWASCQKNKKQNPSWVNHLGSLSNFFAYLTTFIGHYASGAWIGLFSYSVLDQCAPKEDVRKLSVNALLVIVLPILFFLRYASRVIT